FNFRSIGVAELFVNRLLPGQSIVISAPQRDVMMRTRAKRPASGRAIRLVKERDRLVRAPGARLEAMVGAIHAGLAEAKSFHEEPLGLGDLANREHGPVKSVHCLA